MNNTRYTRSRQDDRDINAALAAIDESPGGIYVLSDGSKTFIRSNRPTEIMIGFDAPTGVNFNDMSLNEIREFLRKKLDESGFEDVRLKEDQ